MKTLSLARVFMIDEGVCPSQQETSRMKRARCAPPRTHGDASDVAVNPPAGAVVNSKDGADARSRWLESSKA
jgi:hypothetical protein